MSMENSATRGFIAAAVAFAAALPCLVLGLLIPSLVLVYASIALSP